MDTATVEGEAGTSVDRDAVLFAELYSGLRRFAAVTASRGDDPDDLVQEAVARTLRRQSLSSLDHPAAYLRRAIVHLASNRRRSLARGRAAMGRADADTEAQPPEYSSDLADLMRVA